MCDAATVKIIVDGVLSLAGMGVVALMIYFVWR